MGSFKALAFTEGKWFPWFLKAGLIGLVMFAGLTYEDQVGEAETGLLCISECTTCPIICSPPPPPQLESSSPPPSLPPVHRSPSRLTTPLLTLAAAI
ncbi:leucine-rich repeat extensin-like protein 3 [Prunus yedoensis var. nudiflora]|uniref:Leucine-rich repeat extensin-like protein 3 n=1 Tax=Prunus yedoensis var. nudiflora TaxID=2094558 RepID=A0A314UJP3_PRUYE|nr:leucine-rich repeat extensin-like protein 3 [Prunus yedoensis var. nudiflora]